MRLNDFNRKLKNEYKNTFKKTKIKRNWNFQFKLRYVFLGVFVLVFISLFIEHIYVQIYNSILDDRIEERINSKEISTINNKSDYQKAKTSYSFYEKVSTLTSLLSIRIGCSDARGELGTGEMPQSPETNNSYETNVQTKGIDEADVSKCDGNYVYSLVKNSLVVYKLDGTVVASVNDDGKEIYVSDNYIISIGYYSSVIYEFNNGILTEKYILSYKSYIDSRLKDNRVYFVVSNDISEENINYGNCFYDGMCFPTTLYSIVEYDLNTLEVNSVQTLSGNNACIYMSDNNFYIASTSYLTDSMTSIMMYNHELEPIGVMKVKGTTLNQFSMDEYNNYFRIVTTDNTQEAERLNAISIFDLSNLSLVGYLNEGIGIGRQTIRSVRFDKDTCYAVTYENFDPLYEISLEDPTNPVIISKYEAPGFSNYLHTFTINGEEYVLGLGFTDNRSDTKISVYKNTTDTAQVGQDYILGYDNYYNQCDYINRQLNTYMFTNHKSLFIYNDGTYLFLGANVAFDEYVIFKIDVNNSYPVSIYKTISLNDRYDVRSFLIDGKLLVTTYDGLLVIDWMSE